MATPALYGITHSNRDFSDSYYWGKNQFNSAFPVALACYMRDRQVSSAYIRLGSGSPVICSDLSIQDVFGTALPNERLYFAFESVYEPFNVFVEDQLPSIDLVVKENSGGYIRPLEIKLTTLPDDSTFNFPEDKYGAEIVVRSPTSKYMALSIVESLGNTKDRDAVAELFSPCRSIRDWTNIVEAKVNLPKVLDILEQFFRRFAHLQRPLLIQPVWKTMGKTPQLADFCLDIFTWSDFALSRLFMESAKEGAGDRITRQQRSALRFARFIYDWSVKGKVYQAPIYDGMTYDTLNDKEFSISGRKTNALMKCPRLTKLAIHKDEIKNIILGGGQKHLSPERRFDAIIYFSTDLFDDADE